ncbi:MAG: adenosylcobinamide-GDP ribazoletransferase [Clostridium sp.]
MKNLFNAFNMDIGMFTILPPLKKVWDEKSGKHMMKLYPIIGLIVGVLWYAGTIILKELHLPNMLLSVFSLGIPFFLTGFIHLDGFMDVSDAILSRRDRETKLKILKDSRVGAFSVISLAFLLLVDFSSLNEIVLSKNKLIFLILIPFISRSIVGYFLIKEKPINESYFVKLYREGTGILDIVVLLLFFLIGMVVFLIIGYKYLLIPVCMLLFGFYLLWNCKKNFGGINGDVGGYTLALIEMIGLIVLCII